MRHDELKAKQRRLREGFPQDLGPRVHRAISWIGRAEQEAQDHEAADILRAVMPVMVDIMMDITEEDWGQPFYPVVTAPAARGMGRQDRR